MSERAKAIKCGPMVARAKELALAVEHFMNLGEYWTAADQATVLHIQARDLSRCLYGSVKQRLRGR